MYANAKKLIHGQPLTIFSPHRLGDLLASRFLSELSESRLQQFHLVFLDNPQVSVGRSPQLNPLSSLPSLPLSSEPPAYSCSEVLESLMQPPHNLFSKPLPNPELTLFIDGSSKRDPSGNRRAAYAVVTTREVLEAQPLPPGTTSQKAELTALTRALHLAEGKRANIYTDSKYAFLIAHSQAAIWKERGFLTTKGSPICNAPHITRLLDALSLPKEVAIIHCKGHQNTHDIVALGNNMADQVAQQITLQQAPEPLLTLRSTLNPDYSSKEARALLVQEGAQRHPLGWILLHNKPVLPERQAKTIISQIHNTLHIGPRALFSFLSPVFSPPHLRQTIYAVHQSCLTCASTSPQGGLRPPQETHQLRGHMPGQDWQIDFTHMPRQIGRAHV